MKLFEILPRSPFVRIGCGLSLKYNKHLFFKQNNYYLKFHICFNFIQLTISFFLKALFAWQQLWDIYRFLCCHKRRWIRNIDDNIRLRGDRINKTQHQIYQIQSLFKKYGALKNINWFNKRVNLNANPEVTRIIIDQFICSLRICKIELILKERPNKVYCRQSVNEWWTQLIQIRENASYTPKDIHNLFEGSFDVETKCKECEDESPVYSTENFLQLSCFISTGNWFFN